MPDQFNFLSSDRVMGLIGEGQEGAVIYLDFRAAVGSVLHDIFINLPRKCCLFQETPGVGDKQPEASRPRSCPHINSSEALGSHPDTGQRIASHRGPPGCFHTEGIERCGCRRAMHIPVGRDTCAPGLTDTHMFFANMCVLQR